MQLTFLGTSAGTPTRKRNVTSMVLSFPNGRHWLFDCGEGTQHQLLHTSIKPGKIDRIFLTHFHGDHWYGLFGLLSSMKVHGRKSPVSIYSPPGLETALQSVYALSESRLAFPVNFTELTGIYEMTTPENYAIKAVPIKHSVPTFAYCISEPNHRGAFDIEKARALGLDKPEDLQILSKGGQLNKKGKIYHGRDFRLAPRDGLRIALLGDTCDASALQQHFPQPDWLTHECTYAPELRMKALEFSHSTALMAADLAKKLKAKNLILTHFSPRYDGNAGPSVEDLAKMAEEAVDSQQTKIHVAEDFRVFDLSL